MIGDLKKEQFTYINNILCRVLKDINIYNVYHEIFTKACISDKDPAAIIKILDRFNIVQIVVSDINLNYATTTTHRLDQHTPTVTQISDLSQLLPWVEDALTIEQIETLASALDMSVDGGFVVREYLTLTPMRARTLDVVKTLLKSISETRARVLIESSTSANGYGIRFREEIIGGLAHTVGLSTKYGVELLLEGIRVKSEAERILNVYVNLVKTRVDLTKPISGAIIRDGVSLTSHAVKVNDIGNARLVGLDSVEFELYKIVFDL